MEMDQALLAVGCYTREGNAGIRVFRWDPEVVALKEVAAFAGVENPTWLLRHPALPVVYAVSEVKEGAVVALGLDPATGILEELGRQSSGGAGPCHLDVDPAGRLLAVANYGGGSCAVFPLDEEGAIGPACATVSYRGSGPHPQRQERPHAHQARFGPGGLLHVVDLGTDRVRSYAVDGGLAERAVLEAAPGAGPRHLAFAPDGRTAWLANELDNTVTVCAVGGDGRLSARGTWPTLPAGFTDWNTVAAVVHDAARNRLYVSNRGHDSVAVFAVEDGGLRALGHRPVFGAHPRDIALDPTGRFLLCACGEGGVVTALPLDDQGPAVTLVTTPQPVRLCRL